MKLPHLKIRNLESELPVIQAGMGVRIASAELAGAAVHAGGFGTIASVGLASGNKTRKAFLEESSEQLLREVQSARSLSGNKKTLGVNIMVALSNYEEMVQASLDANVDFIISGAGLPLSLPKFVGDADVALIPVVSGGRALELIVKTWKRKYNRKPDAIVVEGPKCGGHLGFSLEQLENKDECSLEILLAEAKAVLAKYDIDVPIIAAGEVANRDDVENAIEMGFDGVQIGTRFIITDEAGVAPESKEQYLKATSEDIVVIKSPVGMPLRVLKTPLVERVLSGGIERFTCPYRCLKTCNPAVAPFCIANALIATCDGDIENGLFMTGCNLESLESVEPIKAFFDTLRD